MTDASTEDMIPKPNAEAARKSVDVNAACVEARAAWARGDFVACDSLLDGLGSGDSTQRAEIAFLRARALLRLDRPADALPVLVAVADLSGTDVVATRRMLNGTTLARTGRLDDGLAELQAAARFAEMQGAHPAILAEISYYRALGLRQLGRTEEADACATTASRACADVISARAMALRGWVAVDLHRYRDAHGHFTAAARAIAACRELDVDLAARVEHALAMLEVDLRCLGFSGGHRDRYRRALVTPLLTEASTPIPRLLTQIADAWAFALDGDVTCALDCVWAAEPLARAASGGWPLVAMVERAALTRALGEVGSARKMTEAASELAGQTQFDETNGDARFALLQLADELVRFDVARGVATFDRYRALARDPNTLTTSNDPRLIAQERYVEGLVHRAAGDRLQAHIALREAYTLFRKAGYLWRAALALIELDATPLAGTSQDSLHAATLLVKAHFPKSFLTLQLGAWSRAIEDDVVASLPTHLREVLRLILEGLLVKEVALRVNKRVNTVRSYLTDIEKAFGVRSVPALHKEARRRGLL